MKKNVLNFIEIIKELNYILDKSQKKRAILVICSIIISSFFELIGVTAILPFIQVIMEPQKLTNQPFIKVIIDFLGISSTNGLFLLCGATLMIVYIFKNGYMILAYCIQFNYSGWIQKQLSEKMLHSYMSRPYEFFLNINSAEIVRGCSGDIAGVYVLLSNLFGVLTDSLTILLIGILLIYEEPLIAIGVLIIMSIMLFGIIMGFKPVVKRLGYKKLEIGTLVGKTLYQIVGGIKEIYVMRRMENFLGKYKDVAEKQRKMQQTYDIISICPDRITEAICVSGIIGIICFRMLIPGTNTMEIIPKLGIFAMAAFKVFPLIGKLANKMTGIVYQRPALTNVYKNILEANEFEKGKREYEAHNVEAGIGLQEIKFTDSLVISGVSWNYKNQKASVLVNAELEIKKGQSVAFIGASGSGKTTLSDIILGLLHPKQGNVTMDGIDVYSIPRAWSKIVGYVPQAVYLTDDTVRNNVAFGLFEDQISDEQIWNALAKAQLREFIVSLPNGLDTIVGERGIKFSGGQKQRIAIARALYHKPEILVLDEATAALDNETEAAVMDSINALQGHITMIIVAHRLTTIRNCDVIYEIKDGVVLCRKKEEVLTES